jgi:FAH family protein
MNIIIVRNNYGDSALIDKTVTPRYDFLPETAQLRNERPLFLPDFANPASVSLYLAVRICRLGRSISERFAHRYYDAATVIPHFSVPLDPNGQSADSELSFAATQGFDNALPTGRYLPIDRDQLAACSFSLSVDGQEQLNGLGSALRFDADHLIAHLSNYHTVRNGDLLLLGAPAAQLLIHPEKRVETHLNGECVLSFKTK